MQSLSGAKCRVVGCDQKHAQHYCRLCEDKDSTHFARNCPLGVDLYHGTRVVSLSPISLKGLQPSSSGRLGAGVYFTTKEEAFKIAEQRGAGQGIVVLKCRVNLGKCKDYGRNEGDDWIKQGYQSAKAMHPPWAAIQGHFGEWVLKDPRKLRITEVHMVGGKVNGEINLPRVDIHLDGKCYFVGKITAGKLLISGDVTIGG